MSFSSTISRFFTASCFCGLALAFSSCAGNNRYVAPESGVVAAVRKVTDSDARKSNDVFVRLQAIDNQPVMDAKAYWLGDGFSDKYISLTPGEHQLTFYMAFRQGGNWVGKNYNTIADITANFKGTQKYFLTAAVNGASIDVRLLNAASFKTVAKKSVPYSEVVQPATIPIFIPVN